MKFKLSIILTILLLSISSFAASPGSLDSSFGIAGRISTDFLGNDVIVNMETEINGKITALVRNNSNPDFIIARYTANGVLDSSFSGDGKRFVDFGGTTDFPSASCLQPDGKTIVAGWAENGVIGEQQVAIARLNPDGSNDLSFSGDGITTLPFPFGPSDCAIQADGKILFDIDGVGPNGFDSISTLRLNTNGSLDTTFGNNGLVETTVPNSISSSDRLAIQSDGKIIVAGGRFIPGVDESLVIRYNSNGSLDTTFSGDGIAIFNFALNDERINSIDLDSSGKIILGISAKNSGISIARVARLQQNGSLDPLFSGSGVVNIDVPETTNESMVDVFVQSDNSILAVLQSAGTDGFLTQISSSGGNTTKFGANGFKKLSSILKSTFLGDKLLIGTISNSDINILKINLSKTPTITADFDGDGVTDTAVFRPSTGNWFVLRSSDNSFQAFQFGLNGDVPIDGDFDGDGKSDLAIYRPSNGVWFFQRSSDGTNLGVTFGISTDRPIPGDYDKDGKTDIAVFRPSTGEWLILRSSTNFSTFFGFPFGQNGDIPISSERK